MFLITAVLLLFTLPACDPAAPGLDDLVISFSLAAADNAGLSEDVSGTLNGTSISLQVPYGTDLTALVPLITLADGATVTPESGTAVDFSSTVTFTVTGSDGTSTDYTVTVNTESTAIDSKSISSFELPASENEELSEDAAGTIVDYSISVIVPDGTDLRTLTPRIIYDGSAIHPGNLVQRDFSSDASYIVMAEDGTTAIYTVSVALESEVDARKSITSFVFKAADNPALSSDVQGTIGTSTVTATVPYGTDRAALVPTIVHTGKSISPVSGSARDFTSAQAYTVTAGDDTTAEYTVNVSVAAHDPGDPLVEGDNVFSNTLVQQLDQADLTASDYFGGDASGSARQAAAFSADGSTLVIGAPFCDLTGTDEGSAFVFEESGGIWSHTATLSGSEVTVSDSFGSSTAISSDGSIIAVGAQADEPAGGSNDGLVYVYVRSGSSWSDTSETTYLYPNVHDGDCDFGDSLSMSADGSIIASGAFDADADGVGGAQRGEAYVFEEPPLDGWASFVPGVDYQSATLQASAALAQNGAMLGFSVALSEDGTTVAAGAHHYDNGHTRDGMVFVFEEPIDGWDDAPAEPRTMNESAVLTASDAEDNMNLGTSVVVNSDGSRIASGAIGADGATDDNAGAVYIYERSGASWADADEDDKIVAHDGHAGNSFGCSVAFSTSGLYLLVGDYQDDVGYSNDGSAYLYEYGSGSYSYSLKFSEPGNGMDGAYMGSAVAISPEAGVIAVTAPGWDDGGVNAKGTVYIYQ